MESMDLNKVRELILNGKQEDLRELLKEYGPVEAELHKMNERDVYLTFKKTFDALASSDYPDNREERQKLRDYFRNHLKTFIPVNLLEESYCFENAIPKHFDSHTGSLNPIEFFNKLRESLKHLGKDDSDIELVWRAALHLSS